MPRDFPDPDDRPDPRWLAWFVGATIAAFMAVNLWRGVTGSTWNW